MDRRNFLRKSIAATALVVATPAIVRAESLMKLYIPKPLMKDAGLFYCLYNPFAVKGFFKTGNFYIDS